MRGFLKRSKFLFAATLVASAGIRLANAQIDGSWSVNADGSWSLASNWSSNPGHPDAGGSATLGTFSVSHTVTLDVPVSLSKLENISGSSGSNSIGWTVGAVAPAVTLTFTGAATLSNATHGTLTINTPINIPTGSALTTVSAGSLWINGSITGNLIVNNAYPGSVAIGRTDIFNTLTGALTVNNGTFNLNSPAVNPGLGDGRIAGTTGITINQGTVQLVNSNNAISDRIDDDNPMTLNAGSLLFFMPKVGGVNEALGSITVNGFSTIGEVAATRVNFKDLIRTNRGVLLLRGSSLGQSGSYISPGGLAYAKFSNATNEANLIASMVGTSAPIVPWMIGDINGTGTGSGFLTYVGTNGVDPGTSTGPGFSVAATSSNLGDGSITDSNIALNTAATFNTGATMNSLLVSGGPIRGNGTLTIASGALALVSLSSHSPDSTSITNPIRFGASNDREAIITVTAGSLSAFAPSLTLSGTISTSGGLTTAGLGNLILSGTNTYTGGTVIEGNGTFAPSISSNGGHGTLTISADANLGAVPGVVTPDSIRISYANLEVSSSMTLDAKRGITLIGNGTLGVAAGATLSYAGAITDNGADRMLVKSDRGVLLLSGNTNNSYGSLAITDGTVALGAANAIPTSAGVFFQFGTVDLKGFDQTVGEIGTFGIASSGLITNSAGGMPATFTVNNGSANSFAGPISGNLNLAKSGAGTLTLTASNTYTGNTVVQRGALFLGTRAQAAVLSIGGGADIQGGRVIFAFTTAATIRPILAASFANNGFDNTTEKIRSSTATAAKGLGFLDDGSNTTVAYTWYGDANLDGLVNALDFNALATNFGGSSGKFWYQADFNFDGVTNTADFTALANNFNQPALAGSPLGPALGTIIPEPAGICLLAIGFRHRRRRGK